MANHPSLMSNSKELKYITAILILREERRKEREGRRRGGKGRKEGRKKREGRRRGGKGEKGGRAKGERRDRSELMKLSPSLLSSLVSFHLIYNYTPFPTQMATGGTKLSSDFSPPRSPDEMLTTLTQISGYPSVS